MGVGPRATNCRALSRRGWGALGEGLDRCRLDAVAAPLLGAVEREVGALQQDFLGGTVAG